MDRQHQLPVALLTAQELHMHLPLLELQVLTSNGASAPTWQNATAAVSAFDESTDATCFPLFANNATGSIVVKTDASGLTYDSANERLQSTDVAVKGAVRCENSASTERFEILYNETTDSLDFTYLHHNYGKRRKTFKCWRDVCI